ncbi:unnamed protein product [Arctogadus glacialis]
MNSYWLLLRTVYPFITAFFEDLLSHRGLGCVWARHVGAELKERGRRMTLLPPAGESGGAAPRRRPRGVGPRGVGPPASAPRRLSCGAV